MQTYTIESLDQEGRGIARRDGKTVFIEGALTGEVVTASVYRKKPSYEQANVQRIVRESPQRVTPQCVNFGRSPSEGSSALLAGVDLLDRA